MKIGIDMGGTNLRAALVDTLGVVKKEQVASPAQGTEQEAIDALSKLIERLFGDGVEGIGAGIPSVIDRENGIVYNATNIPSWKEVRLKDILQRRFGVKAAIDNDSNCFTLGVARYGEGRRFSNFVGATLGTGLGGGIIIDGQLYGGENGGAGEIGSLAYLDSDLEHYCSSMFFTRVCHATAEELYHRATSGDAEAAARWQEFGRHMGNMVKAVMFAYDPEAVIIGGGIARAFALFEPSMRATVATFPYPKSVERLHILPSTLPDAALLGAASLV